MTKQELLQKPLEERRDYLVNLVKNKTHDFQMFSKAGGNKCKSFIIKCMRDWRYCRKRRYILLVRTSDRNGRVRMVGRV